MIALVELDAALLGLLQRDLAAAQFLVEELERLAGLAAVAREVLLVEGVDQALDGAGGGARILAVGEAGDVRGRLDLEAAVGLGGDGDALAQAVDDPGSRSRSLATRLLRSVRRTTRTRFSFEVRVCFSRSIWSLRSSAADADLVGQRSTAAARTGARATRSCSGSAR